MSSNFQHPPGAEARSFIASCEVTLDPGASTDTPDKQIRVRQEHARADADHPLHGRGGRVEPETSLDRARDIRGIICLTSNRRVLKSQLAAV
jgi:hypothetical protein